MVLDADKKQGITSRGGMRAQALAQEDAACDGVKEMVLGPMVEGQRLDRALGELFPQWGLRARRRLCDEGKVLVNGMPRACGHRVRAGDVLRVTLPSALCAADGAGALPDGLADAAGDGAPVLGAAADGGQDGPRWLETHGNWMFFHKPAGLHTAALTGRGGPSLEGLLPQLLPALAGGAGEDLPRLCNRLDQGTSGIVVAARDMPAAEDWRRTEDAGLCVKQYVALLCGCLREPVTVNNALDTHKRRVTRVLAEVAPPLRHTRLVPLEATCAGALAERGARVFAGRGEVVAPWLEALRACEASTPLTLALCRIRKGARHQIRAHAAHAGHPLWGDGLYGAPVPGTFLLHHHELRMPGAVVHDVCPWRGLLP